MEVVRFRILCVWLTESVSCILKLCQIVPRVNFYCGNLTIFSYCVLVPIAKPRLHVSMFLLKL